MHWYQIVSKIIKRHRAECFHLSKVVNVYTHTSPWKHTERLCEETLKPRSCGCLWGGDWVTGVEESLVFSLDPFKPLEYFRKFVKNLKNKNSAILKINACQHWVRAPDSSCLKMLVIHIYTIKHLPSITSTCEAGRRRGLRNYAFCFTGTCLFDR